jgi:hypothetical protein
LKLVEPREDVTGRPSQVAHEHAITLTEQSATLNLADHEAWWLPNRLHDARLDVEPRNGKRPSQPGPRPRANHLEPRAGNLHTVSEQQAQLRWSDTIVERR